MFTCPQFLGGEGGRLVSQGATPKPCLSAAHPTWLSCQGLFDFPLAPPHSLSGTPAVPKSQRDEGEMRRGQWTCASLSLLSVHLALWEHHGCSSQASWLVSPCSATSLLCPWGSCAILCSNFHINIKICHLENPHTHTQSTWWILCQNFTTVLGKSVGRKLSSGLITSQPHIVVRVEVQCHRLSSWWVSLTPADAAHTVSLYWSWGSLSVGVCWFYRRPWAALPAVGKEESLSPLPRWLTAKQCWQMSWMKRVVRALSFWHIQWCIGRGRGPGRSPRALPAYSSHSLIVPLGLGTRDSHITCGPLTGEYKFHPI